MPFQSKAQMAYMYSKHPEIAKRWSGETPNPGKLPEHKGAYTKEIIQEARRKAAMR